MLTVKSFQSIIEDRDWQTHVLEYCLRASTFFCFAGWAWGHLYWEPSYTSILWSDVTFEWIQQFGYDWDDFAGTGANDGLVQRGVQGIGWLLVGGAILSLTATRTTWIQLFFLSMSSLLLSGIAISKYIKSEFELPMLIEHGGQILSPILLVMALRLGVRHRITIGTAVVAVWLTFTGHGLYAVGLWPTPSTFIGMTRSIFGWNYEFTKLFLQTAGVLDFAVCCGMLIPVLRRPCACYAFFWGLLTAAARPVAGMCWDLNYWGADQFMHGLSCRAPHWFIPLFLFLSWTFMQFDNSNNPPKSAPNDPESV